jgi:hypothetical protein
LLGPIAAISDSHPFFEVGMARDNFSRDVIDRLAKRAGMKCSNPNCRQPTSGPDSEDGVTNTGVAAHMTAASPSGARYDGSLTSEDRSAITNGIWLCQTHAKLIDDDELSFPVAKLREWKELAENMASLEARGFAIIPANGFAKLETKIPALMAEMREDLRQAPLTREFIIMSQKWAYNAGTKPFFVYYYETHPEIESMITIMEHYQAVYNVTFNNVKRYNFSEPFVEYILGN